MTLQNNFKYTKWVFSIGYFERYVSWKSDYLELLLSVCLIHRILNERKTSHLHQDCLYQYKNKELYMYWVLFVVLLDLQQGPIVLNSSLFSIICKFVGHGGEIFVWGVLRGVMACGGWWHSVGGVTLEWGGGGGELATMRPPYLCKTKNPPQIFIQNNYGY